MATENFQIQNSILYFRGNFVKKEEKQLEKIIKYKTYESSLDFSY